MLDKTIKKSAVVIDGGYLRKMWELNAAPLTQQKVIDVGTKVLTDKEELFRVYYYDCPPFEKKLTNPISNTQYHGNNSHLASLKALLSNVGTSDLVALRSGVLRFNGWGLRDDIMKNLMTGGSLPCPLEDRHFRPLFKQKGIDMKIGLDIAWLAIRKIVSRIILVAGDADFIPAMKLARVEGVQIVLVPFQHSIAQEMREHSDEVRVMDITKI